MPSVVRRLEPTGTARGVHAHQLIAVLKFKGEGHGLPCFVLAFSLSYASRLSDRISLVSWVKCVYLTSTLRIHQL